MLSQETRQLCQLFAGVFDYPGEPLTETTTECVRRCDRSFPAAAEPMRSFAAFAGEQSPQTLEEIYTRTFDINPATSLYVGYHLFGETAKRSAFMARLEETYQARQFSSGKELPDHLCVLLRFLSVSDDPEFVTPLVQECILPVLEKAAAAFEKDNNGYGPALSSLRSFLTQVTRELNKSGRSAA